MATPGSPFSMRWAVARARPARPSEQIYLQFLGIEHAIHRASAVATKAQIDEFGSTG